MVIAEAADRLPSETASDWVTYADYVVVVSPAAAKFGKPTDQELARGEGSVLRSLTMKVDRVVWSNPKAAAPPPSGEFTYLAFGYSFANGKPEERVPMAAAGEPRLELHHDYVMALSWQAARCTEDDHVPAGWRGLGSGGALPFDHGVIGNGEFEGSIVTASEYQTQFSPRIRERMLGPSLAGQPIDELVKTLTGAAPEPKQDFLPPPAPCS